MRAKTPLTLLIALAIPLSAAAGERDAIEICGNSADDEGDGAVDESECYDPDAPSAPVSGGGIVPELWMGNPDCGDLGFGHLFGFKIDQTPATGAYAFTSQDGVLDGGPEDPNNHISIGAVYGEGSEVTAFDWASTLPVAAVFVKAQGGNAYVYETWSTSDTGLGTPGEQHAISHVTFCYGYALDVTKTAEAEYTRQIDWTVTKDVEPASRDVFIGQTADFDYTVSVEKQVTETDFAASGVIAVHNPSPWYVDFEIDDAMGEITPVVVCPSGDHTGSLGPAGSGTDTVQCTYQTSLPDKTTRENTATVTSLTDGIIDGEASADVVFGAPTTISGHDSITVVDTNSGTPDGGWTTSKDASWPYTHDVSCPTDPAQYTDGALFIETENTATIVETGASDTEFTTVGCYAPLVGKDVSTSYRRAYDWQITKTVAPQSHTGFAGDSMWSTYEVAVDRTVTEDQFEVSGTITVENPHPSQDMTIAIADSLPGVTLACGGTLQVPANSSADCTYVASLDSRVDGVNTATASFNGLQFVANAPYAFGEPTTVEGPSQIGVTDTNGETWSTGADSAWNYSREFTCPTDAELYVQGQHSYGRPNTATIDETGDAAHANVDVTCLQPAVAHVVKSTQEGPLDIGSGPFVFRLYDHDSTLVEQVSLTGPGEVSFATELDAGTWRVVEVPTDGWVTEPESCTFAVTYPDNAGDVLTCSFDNREMSELAVLKTTNGVVDDSIDWTFALYEGLQGYGGSIYDQATAPADLQADGKLYLGYPLDPTQGWTLCELGVPAGWIGYWSLEAGGAILPYNPDATGDTPQDLGNRCVDLGAGSDLPLVEGTALGLQVDNVAPPGGQPRTPGYWKNWSTCSNGNQAETAAKNGGPEEGFYLLDDLLPIRWDDMQTDRFVFEISTCEQGVALLASEELEDLPTRGRFKGTNRSNDPAYKLARNLLAYQLNAKAEACMPATPVTEDGQTIREIARDAELLLDELDFDGTGLYIHNRHPMRYRAQLMSGILDDYNNGLFCGSDTED